MKELLDLAFKKINSLEKKMELYYKMLNINNELDFVIKGTYVCEDEIDKVLKGEY